MSDGFITGNPSDVFLKCLEEVQAISCATLFSPVTRQEAVQAMGKKVWSQWRLSADWFLVSLGLWMVGQRVAERRSRRSHGHGAL